GRSRAAARGRARGHGAQLPSHSFVDASVERVTPDDADPRLDGVAVAASKSRRIDDRAPLGGRQGGRHPCGLGWSQPGGGVLEIALRARFYAVGPDAGLGDVEVDFHDPPLTPDLLDQEREPGFEPLPELAPPLPVNHVLRRLLADRRTSPDASALLVALDRLFDRLPIEPAVLAELAILAADPRADHVAVDVG